MVSFENICSTSGEVKYAFLPERRISFMKIPIGITFDLNLRFQLFFKYCYCLILFERPALVRINPRRARFNDSETSVLYCPLLLLIRPWVFLSRSGYLSEVATLTYVLDSRRRCYKIDFGAPIGRHWAVSYRPVARRNHEAI